jgi:hypothetical protein
MKTSKKNLITEINRIHQLMGVKKVITESRKILVPFLQIAREIVEFAANKEGMDAVTRRAVTELSTGKRSIVDAQGNPIPLEAEDYVRIFDNLKKSTEPEIIAKMAEIDRKVVSTIQDNISELITPDIKTLIKKYVDEGATEDFIVNELQRLFRNTSYGKYADFTTLVDDAGRSVETLVDDYLREIRKVYEELGGVLDNVVDDVTPSSGSYPTIPERAFDEASQVVADASRFNISRTLADLNPGLYRRLTQMFRGFAEYFGDGRVVRNRILDNLMALDRQAFPDGTKVTDEIALQLKDRVKNDLDKLFQINKNYIALVREAINQGKKTNSPAIVNGQELPAKKVRDVWTGMETQLQEVEKTFGEPGVTLVTMPDSGPFLFLKEAFLHANALPINLSRTIQRRFWANQQLLADVAAAVTEKESIQIEKNITTPLTGFKKFIAKYFFPGSSRGWPKGLKADKESLQSISGSYDKIEKYYSRFPRLMQWASLMSEKIILLTEIGVLINMIAGFDELWDFYQTDKEEMQKKYGDCIEKTASWMRDNDVTLDKNVDKFSGDTTPQCLNQLLLTMDDATLKDFLIRAEFFRKRILNIPGSEFINTLLIRDDLKEIGLDILPKLFTGGLLNIAYKFWYDFLEPEYWSQRTGEPTALQGRLEQAREELRQLEPRIENAATQIDMSELPEINIPNPLETDSTTTNSTTVDPFGRTSNDNNP